MVSAKYEVAGLTAKPGSWRQWAANFEEIKPPSREAFKLYWRTCLGLLLWTPIAQAQELPNFSAFVAIFLGFGRSVIGLAEGMFSIADCFLNQVQCLSHTQFLRSMTASALSRRRLQSCSRLARWRAPQRAHGLQDCNKANCPDFHSFLTPTFSKVKQHPRNFFCSSL